MVLIPSSSGNNNLRLYANRAGAPVWRPYNLALFVFVPMVFSVFIAYQNIIESVDSTGIYVENISDEKFLQLKAKNLCACV